MNRSLLPGVHVDCGEREEAADGTVHNPSLKLCRNEVQNQLGQIICNLNEVKFHS